MQTGVERVGFACAGDGRVLEQACIGDVEAISVKRERQAERIGPGGNGGMHQHPCGVDDSHSPVALVESVEGLAVGRDHDGGCETPAEVVSAYLAVEREFAFLAPVAGLVGANLAGVSGGDIKKRTIGGICEAGVHLQVGVVFTARGNALNRRLPGVGPVDDVQSERKPDRRDRNLRAVGAHRERKRIGRQRDPVARRMNFAPIGQYGSHA